MACWVRPWRRQRRARCWRDSVAQQSRMIGSSSRARAHAARQVTDMIGNAVVHQRRTRPADVHDIIAQSAATLAAASLPAVVGFAVLPITLAGAFWFWDRPDRS